MSFQCYLRIGLSLYRSARMFSEVEYKDFSGWAFGRYNIFFLRHVLCFIYLCIVKDLLRNIYPVVVIELMLLITNFLAVVIIHVRLCERCRQTDLDYTLIYILAIHQLWGESWGLDPRFVFQELINELWSPNLYFFANVKMKISLVLYNSGKPLASQRWPV